MKLKKYLIALPCFPNDKGFCHQTILVSSKNKESAINLAYKIKGNYINIGDIKEVFY